MILYILIVIIPQWIGYPGYVPSVIVHRNPTLAYQQYAYYAAQHYIVTMQKGHD